MGLNEANTKARLINRNLAKAGWNANLINYEFPVSFYKRIYKKGVLQRFEKKVKFADYLLIYKEIPLAIIEAKREDISALEGKEQAVNYAKQLKIPYSYCTNGHQIFEINTLTKIEKEISWNFFPSPNELYNRYLIDKHNKIFDYIEITKENINDNNEEFIATKNMEDMSNKFELEEAINYNNKNNEISFNNINQNKIFNTHQKKIPPKINNNTNINSLHKKDNIYQERNDIRKIGCLIILIIILILIKICNK